MFDRLELLIGKNKLDKLKQSKILVLGIGGVGGYVATALVRNAVGNITIVDFDKIEASNINRQIIATTKNIGENKTEVLKNILLDINPNMNVKVINSFINEDNIENLFNDKYDYMIDCCDTLNTKKIFIQKCLEKRINFISSMGTANKFNPYAFKIMDIRKTEYDPIAKILRSWVKKEQINSKIKVLCSNEAPIKTNGLGSNAIVPSVAGLLIANEVINDLIC